MKLNKCKLGTLIRQVNEKNSGLKYGISDVKGLSIKKIFIDTKADLNGVSLSPYLIVKPEQFAYVTITSRNSDKITLGYNDSNNTYIVSSSYIVFEVIDKKILDPKYLYMFFNRPEFDRYARFNSWGSAREAFSWEDMCDIDIEFPDIEVQRKYIKIYELLTNNFESYKCELDNLKLISEASLEKMKYKYTPKKLGNYIHRVDNRNKNNEIRIVKGVSTSKEFRDPTSKVNRNELSSYKIVKPREISFVQTTHNEKVFANAINEFGFDIVVTSVNEVFYTDEDVLLPEYLSLFFARKEFDRYARFNSWGSARETFTWEDLKEVDISIPTINEQQSIVNLFDSYKKRKKMCENISKLIGTICPLLINGSLKEASNE